MKERGKNITKKKIYKGFMDIKFRNKSSAQFLRKIATIVNKEGIEDVYDVKIIEHPIEEQFVVIYRTKVIWKGTIEEIKEYKKQGASLLIELFIANINEILIKEKIEHHKYRRENN